METKSRQVYDLIQSKTSSNELVQGLSSLIGFPWTLVVDGAVIVTHYAPMLNSIRKIYGRNQVSSDVIGPIIDGCKSELLVDIIADKVIGQIPMLGLPVNIMCAKTMTWRLGLLFGMLAARGEEISAASVGKAMKVIRSIFPQKSMLKFATPSISTVEKLLTKFEDCTTYDFNSKVDNILDNL